MEQFKGTSLGVFYLKKMLGLVNVGERETFHRREDLWADSKEAKETLGGGKRL